MSKSKITHGSFMLERVYNAAPSRVFAAYTQAEARYRWLITSDGWTVHEYRPAEHVRPGAVEFSKFSPPGAGVALTNLTTFLDVEADSRVIIAYAMTVDGAPLSSSLVTTEFHAEGDGRTRLVLTEQGAYLDGNIKGREEGFGELLEKLAVEVEATATA
jgi:uncharacterized protein YndB with AHSA1/START domain